jgi:hypothetical protein
MPEPLIVFGEARKSLDIVANEVAAKITEWKLDLVAGKEVRLEAINVGNDYGMLEVSVWRNLGEDEDASWVKEDHGQVEFGRAAGGAVQVLATHSVGAYIQLHKVTADLNYQNIPQL